MLPVHALQLFNRWMFPVCLDRQFRSFLLLIAFWIRNSFEPRSNVVMVVYERPGECSPCRLRAVSLFLQI